MCLIFILIFEANWLSFSHTNYHYIQWRSGKRRNSDLRKKIGWQTIWRRGSWGFNNSKNPIRIITQVCSPEPDRRKERQRQETEALKGLKSGGLLPSGDLGKPMRSGYRSIQISGKIKDSSQSLLLGKTVAVGWEIWSKSIINITLQIYAHLSGTGRG